MSVFGKGTETIESSRFLLQKFSSRLSVKAILFLFSFIPGFWLACMMDESCSQSDQIYTFTLNFVVVWTQQLRSLLRISRIFLLCQSATFPVFKCIEICGLNSVFYSCSRCSCVSRICKIGVVGVQYADPKMAGPFLISPAIFESAYCRKFIWYDVRSHILVTFNFNFL